MTIAVQVGNRYGRWTALSRAAHTSHRTWECKCVCGNVRLVRESKLLLAKAGCRCASNGGHTKRHGMSETPEYAVWRTMKARVLDPKNHKFPRYGGRGIKLCDRWLSFDNFLADMGPRPSREHSIERKDNDGDYCPENCEWANRNKQARNRRDTRFFTIDNIARSLADWCEIYSVPYGRVERRLGYGWSIKEALTTPLCRSKYHHKQMREAA